MTTNTKKFIIKVFILSIIIILVYNIWDYYLNANSKVIISNEINNTNTNINKQNFKKIDYSWFWNTSVAITTNIGINFKKIQELPATIYQEIFSISELINNKNAKNELIWNNMIIINEYLNVLKVDVKQLINSNVDKLAILNAYIDQLEFRYTSWINNQKILVEQKTIFEQNITNSDNKVAILKEKIALDFKNNDAKATLKNIEEYTKLKEEYYYSKIYISYINQFLAQYNFLNNYSRDLASLLINNKEAIIKDAYLVIPTNWWLKALSDFKLLFNEGEPK